MRIGVSGILLLLTAHLGCGVQGIGILGDIADGAKSIGPLKVLPIVGNATSGVVSDLKNVAKGERTTGAPLKIVPIVANSSVVSGIKDAAEGAKDIAGEVKEVPSKIVPIVANTTSDVVSGVKEAADNIIVNFSNLTYTNDCLGLGKYFSPQVEAFFKKDANGSRAQDAHFYFWSRKQPHRNEVTIGKQFGLEWTDFEVRHNTVMIVHGFLSTGNETWIQKMTKALLNWEDVNVIVVDWSDGGDTFNYYKAAVNTQTTGNQIATLFGQIANYTTEKSGISRDQWGSIHCIGHSLGSHICGYAAHEMKKRGAPWTIRRITGLDPAQPCFKTADLALKLDKNDAPFVDIIHTNGRIWTDLGLGLPQAIGHVDFYPNGGKQQPGCESSDFKIPVVSIPKEAIAKMICSHGRSYLYFTDSIIGATHKNCTFWSQPWDKTYRNIEHILSNNCPAPMCTEMGINSDKYKMRGGFFVLTASSRPYCETNDSDKEEARSILKEDFKDSYED